MVLFLLLDKFLPVQEHEVMWNVNHDMDNIVTPVDAEGFDELLRDAGYEDDKRNFVIQGFKEGFELNYEGDRQVKRMSKNLKFQKGVGTPLELWNKVMKEVQAGRYAGPFEEPPFEYFIQSPIGLVPKDQGTKTHLIFHLSHPRDVKGGKSKNSVNGCIPEHLCSVEYPDFRMRFVFV